LAGGECVGAVRRADGDRYARFGRRHAAEAMGNDAFYHGPPLAGFGFERGELALGHFVVRFVIEGDSLPAGGKFAGGAEEEDDGAGLGVARSVDEGGCVDGVVGELDHSM
jgi:hypothetical protein